MSSLLQALPIPSDQFHDVMAEHADFPKGAIALLKKRIWITHVCSPFRGCARSKPQFLTAVLSLKFLRLTQVYEWTVLPALQFGECVLETLATRSTKETLSVTNARESIRLILILTLVCPPN